MRAHRLSQLRAHRPWLTQAQGPHGSWALTAQGSWARACTLSPSLHTPAPQRASHGLTRGPCHARACTLRAIRARARGPPNRRPDRAHAMGPMARLACETPGPAHSIGSWGPWARACTLSIGSPDWARMGPKTWDRMRLKTWGPQGERDPVSRGNAHRATAIKRARAQQREGTHTTGATESRERTSQGP